MENKVYYGEYSLKHWIDLILKKNVVLPDYQRYFVWKEGKVRKLIDAFKNQQFVPPVTIGAFQDDAKNVNWIIDGQQRLTSILLAYLGLYPDKETFKKAHPEYADENDDEEEDRPQYDNVIEWTFNTLLEKGKSKKDILENIVKGNYEIVNWGVDESFFDKIFLGFSYLVPDTVDEKDQQRYYSKAFRNMNNEGEPLSAQESRRALYYLNENLARYFDPEFMKVIKIISIKHDETRIDTVRYLSLLSQYHTDNNSADGVAGGFKQKMETYYEKYIYSVVDQEPDGSRLFGEFSSIFPNESYLERYDTLQKCIDSLGIPRKFHSIINMDMYFFGLIYSVVFKGKSIDETKKDQLKADLNAKMEVIKKDSSHLRMPSALKHLRYRIATSIEIYSGYEKK